MDLAFEGQEGVQDGCQVVEVRERTGRNPMMVLAIKIEDARRPSVITRVLNAQERGKRTERRHMRKNQLSIVVCWI